MNEPIINPKTGEPIVPDPAPADPGPEFVPKADFDALSTRLDAFEKGINFGAQTSTPAQTVAPVAPSGPSVPEQIATIDKDLAAVGTDIDKAIVDEQPISNLLVKQRNLADKRLELKINSEHIQPLRDFGTNAINQLSQHAMSGIDDPALKYDFVKKDVDTMMGQVAPEQRTVEVYKKAVALAKGEHMDEIMAAHEEEWLRKNPVQTQDTGGQSGRDTNGGNPDIPKPEDVWDADNLRALREVGKTPEDYVRGRGYENWDDYYTQNKDYFEN